MAQTALHTDKEGQSRTTDWPSESLDQTDATTSPGSGDVDRLPKDVIFGLLSNGRRRRALTYLAEHGPETTLSDLAEHIASIENDKPVAAITSSERKRVYITLYQGHLPKMADANVIDYNQPRGTVELRAEADQLFTYLALTRAESNRTESWRHRLIPDPLHALLTKTG